MLEILIEMVGIKNQYETNGHIIKEDQRKEVGNVLFHVSTVTLAREGSLDQRIRRRRRACCSPDLDKQMEGKCCPLFRHPAGISYHIRAPFFNRHSGLVHFPAKRPSFCFIDILM